MKKLEPKNREEAFSYQFEDDVRVLKAMSLLSPKDFMKALDMLKIHIQAYEILSRPKAKRPRKIVSVKIKEKEQPTFLKSLREWKEDVDLRNNM